MNLSTDTQGRKQIAENGEDEVSFGNRTVNTAEKKKLVSREFDSIAARYDLANTLLSFGLHFLWKRKAVRLLRLRPGDAVLDLCGGTADLALLAAKDVGTEGRIVVYDINRAMMDAGRVKVRKGRLGTRIEFVQGDAEKISMHDRSFDAVMAGFGIRNLAHLEIGLSESWRVLKEGGRFICLDFSLPNTVWLRTLYDVYSFKIMPAAGRLITGHAAAYGYLAESIRLFPQPDRLAAVMREKGFSKVGYTRLTGGIAAIHMAEKG